MALSASFKTCSRGTRTARARDLDGRPRSRFRACSCHNASSRRTVRPIAAGFQPAHAGFVLAGPSCPERGLAGAAPDGSRCRRCRSPPRARPRPAACPDPSALPAAMSGFRRKLAGSGENGTGSNSTRCNKADEPVASRLTHGVVGQRRTRGMRGKIGGSRGGDGGSLVKRSAGTDRAVGDSGRQCRPSGTICGEDFSDHPADAAGMPHRQHSFAMLSGNGSLTLNDHGAALPRMVKRLPDMALGEIQADLAPLRASTAVSANYRIQRHLGRPPDRTA